jgi:hypothetical protein
VFKNTLIVALAAFSICMVVLLYERGNLNRSWQEAAAPAVKDGRVATSEDLRQFMETAKYAKWLAENSLHSKITKDGVEVTYLNGDLSEKIELLLCSTGRNAELKSGYSVSIKYDPYRPGVENYIKISD